MTRGRFAIASLFLVSATLFVYARAMSGPFQFDDEAGILLNPSIQKLSDIGAIVAYKPELPRPLFNLSLAIDYSLYGFNQYGYHITNLIIHLMGVFIVWWLAAEVNLIADFRLPISDLNHKSKIINQKSFLAALIFALHPIATEPTIYIWSRSSAMMTVFCLASIAFYLKYRLQAAGQKPETNACRLSPVACRPIWLLASLAAFLLGVLSKEEALTMPALIMAIDWVLLPGEGMLRRMKAQVMFWIVPLCAFTYRIFAKVTLYDVISWRVTEADEFSELVLHNSVAQVAAINLLTQLKVGLYYAFLLFFPVRGSIDHGISFEENVPGAAAWAGIIFTLIMAAIFFAGRKRLPRAALAIAFFFAPLSIFYLVPVSDVMVERRLYLPLAGFAIWLGDFLTQRLKEHKGKIVFYSLVFLVTLCLSSFFFLTLNRAKIWQDRIALWSDAVNVSPDKLRPHAVLARYLYESGHVHSAIRENLAAIRMKENYGPPIVNLGLIYLDRGDLQTAEKYFRQAVHWHPGADFSAHYNLAVTLARMGRADEGMEEFYITLKINPGHALAMVELGKLLAERGRLDEALGWFREALKINPDFTTARMNLGNVLLDMGRKQEGIQQLEYAAKQAPGDSLIWYNLGAAYFGENRFDAAESAFRNAMRDNNRPEAIFGLAQVRIKQERLTEASSLLRAFLYSVNLTRRPELAPIVNQAQRFLGASPQ